MAALKLPGLRRRNPDRPTMKERIRAAAASTARILHLPARTSTAEASTPPAAAPGLPDPDAALLALAPELERRYAECARLWAVKWEDDAGPEAQAALDAQSAANDLARMIGSLPARSLAGLRVKARALQLLGHEWWQAPDHRDPPETLAVQIAEDLFALAGNGGAVPQPRPGPERPSVILDAGRHLKAVWDDHERNDSVPAEQFSEPWQSTIWARQDAAENMIAATKATTLAEAAVQVMLAIGDVDRVLRSDLAGEGKADARGRLMHLLYSVQDLLARDTGIDLAEFGAETYAPERGNPWRAPAPAESAKPWTLHARPKGVHHPVHPSAQERRQVLALRARIEAAAEALIALLDELDAPAEDLEPDADGEDGGDWEPWLAAPEGHERQLPWCRGGDDDRESGQSVSNSLHIRGAALCGPSHFRDHDKRVPTICKANPETMSQNPTRARLNRRAGPATSLL